MQLVFWLLGLIRHWVMLHFTCVIITYVYWKNKSVIYNMLHLFITAQWQFLTLTKENMQLKVAFRSWFHSSHREWYCYENLNWDFKMSGNCYQKSWEKIKYQCSTTDTNVGNDQLHIRQLGWRLAEKNYQHNFSNKVLQISTTVKQHNHYKWWQILAKCEIIIITL